MLASSLSSSEDSINSLNSMNSINSIDSIESLDSINSIDSIELLNRNRERENRHHHNYFYPSLLMNAKITRIRRIKRLSNWYSNLDPWYDILQEACTYLSMWNILFPYFFRVDKSTLQYTRLVCSVGGAYMTWIHPKTIPVHYLQLYVEPPLTFLLDFLSHHYFFLVSWGFPWTWQIRKHQIMNNNIGVVCNHSFYQAFWIRWIVILYYVWFGVESTKERYNVRTSDIIKILVFSEIFFFFFH